MTMVLWIAPTQVELEFLYITFSLILLFCNTFEFADVVLRSYCRCLYKDCNDVAFGNARVRNKFSISTSGSVVLDDPEFSRETLQ